MTLRSLIFAVALPAFAAGVASAQPLGSGRFLVEGQTSKTQVRTSRTGQVRGEVLRGQRFVANAQSGGWYQIDFRGYPGWVNGTKFSRVSGAAVEITQDATTHQSPGGGTLGNGVFRGQVYVLRRTQGSWVEVQYDERLAWIRSAGTRTLGGAAAPAAPAASTAPAGPAPAASPSAPAPSAPPTTSAGIRALRGPRVGGRLIAFPTAEGEGRFSAGGRGGRVYHVTSLADSGPGTLRAVNSQPSGPLTVVFDVGGVIDLRSPLNINRSRLTIAGQTAPGDGILIEGYQVQISGDDLVIQHLRFRPGDTRKKRSTSGGGFTEDALTVNGRRIMLDHLSASWGIDECLSGGSRIDDVTVQYCVIAEGLRRTKLFHGAYQPNHGGHSMGSLFKPKDTQSSTLSFHHNLWAMSNNRNPALGTYSSSQEQRADLRNNVLYNCAQTSYSSGISKALRVNWIANYLIHGSETRQRTLFDAKSPNKVQIYQRDNLRDSNKNRRFDGRNDGWAMFEGSFSRTSSEYTFEAVRTESATAALQTVLADAGARPWGRDRTDLRVIQAVRDGTGKLIDSQDEVGGRGTIRSGSRVADRDRDGMPDAWEVQYGTDPNQADHNGDRNGDGYTNLETYLWVAQPR